MFEEPEATEHAYLETKANLGSHNLRGAVFYAAPEKYNYVLYITTEMKGYKFDIDDLKITMYKLWHQGGGKPRGYDSKNEIILSEFTGTCYSSKIQGHKATDCPEKGKGGNGGQCGGGGFGRGHGGGRGNQG
jgi:hypothetical protein